MDPLEAVRPKKQVDVWGWFEKRHDGTVSLRGLFYDEAAAWWYVENCAKLTLEDHVATMKGTASEPRPILSQKAKRGLRLVHPTPTKRDFEMWIEKLSLNIVDVPGLISELEKEDTE